MTGGRGEGGSERFRILNSPPSPSWITPPRAPAGRRFLQSETPAQPPPPKAERLNLNESQKTLASSVSTIDASASALKKYLLTGGITEDQIELGPINSNAIMEYVNGNQTGRILSYQAYRSVTVRTKDVQLVAKLSNNIGTLLATGVNVGNYGPAYYLSTLDKMRAKLLASAMKDAKERATAITEAVGGKVGALVSVSSGPTQVTTKNSLDRAAGGIYDVSTIEKTVNVTLSASFKTQ